METNYKQFMKAICVIFFLTGFKIYAQSQSFNYGEFLQGTVSGGGSITASINNNIFSLSFSAGFSEAYMKQGQVAELTNFSPIPNTEISISPGNFFSDKGYKFYLINNKICIYSTDPQPLTSFPSGTIISVDLSVPTTISNEMIDYFSSSKNKIITREYYTDQGQNGNKKTSIMYLDGLGRELQNVLVSYTPSQKDLVLYSTYDGSGRLNKEYLPVASTQNNGILISEANIASLASTLYNGETPYSEKIFDDSPLNRVVKQAAPGTAWSKNSGHEVKYEETINSSADNVKVYNIPVNLIDDVYEPSFINSFGNYITGYLYKKITKDEDWIPASGNNNTTEEYINKEGQTILVRKYIDGRRVDTYYIYDIYGNLTYVLPPLASAYANIDQTILSDLCYQYKYDKKNRLVAKKLPGKDWEYMVYDKADRLVLTQDANLAAQGRWLLTKYDRFGRVIYTGMIIGQDRASMQNQTENLVITETPHSTGFNKNGITVYYTTVYFGTPETVLSVNYYDTYPSDYASKPNSIQGVNILPLYNNANNIVVSPKGLPTASYVKNIEDDNWTKNYLFYDVKSRSVGTHSYNHLGGFTKIESVLDFAGIPLKIFTYHSRTGLASNTTKIEETFTYDSQNRLIKHQHNVNNNAVSEVLAQNKYNEIGQLIEKKVGGTGTAGTELQTIDYKYNVRGWLTDMNDPTDVATMGTDLFGYKIRYNENIAGLQNPNVLNYPHLKVESRFNGNIAEIDWNAVDETGVPPYSSPLRYGYVYDHMNRLQAGFFQEPNNPSKGTNSEIIEGYDLNGNIKQLVRFAWRPKSNLPAKIDDLAFTYNGGGNKVTNIDDTSNNTSGYEGGNGLIEYDLNGNMRKMPDKGITNIVYNYLNLPKEIVQTNNTKYFYRADGVKIKKTFTLNNAIGSTVINSEYLDGFQYITNPYTTVILQALKETDDNTLSAKTAGEEESFREIREPEFDNAIPENQQDMLLSFFPTAEGFYDYRKRQYIYQYKDHLGNIRSSYAKNKITNVIEILDRNDYYPFGMNFYSHYGSAYDAKGTAYNYKYTGKELQETGMYDYGARFYMPDIGRWKTLDPIIHFEESNYSAVSNNPILYFDPDGRDIEPFFNKFKNKDLDFMNEKSDPLSNLKSNIIAWKFDPKSGSFTAEPGDSAWTLYDQFLKNMGYSWEEVKQIFNENGYALGNVNTGNVVVVKDISNMANHLQNKYRNNSETIKQLETQLSELTAKISDKRDWENNWNEEKFRVEDAEKGTHYIGFSIKQAHSYFERKRLQRDSTKLQNQIQLRKNQNIQIQRAIKSPSTYRIKTIPA